MMPYYHAVVHHLDEVAGTAEPAIEISTSSAVPLTLVPSGGAGNIANARGDGFENRFRCSTTAVGRRSSGGRLVQGPDAAAGANVDV